MRKNRIIWLITWIISLIIISFFGGPVSYGFFAVVTLVPVISVLYLASVYILFHVYQKIDTEWPVANQTVPFYFTLMNDYYWIFSGIRVKFYSSFSNISGLNENIEYELFPNSGISKETTLVCKYRGEYEVGIKTVIIQDFFRLFCFSYHNREPLVVTVRPKLVMLESMKNVNINAIARESSMYKSEPDVLVRKYVPGDDIRHIHWGVTAKSDELMIRERIGNEQQGIGIVMSTQRYGEEQPEYLPIENKMLELDLAIAMYFSKEGIPVTHFHRATGLETTHIARMDQFDDYYDYISRVIFDESKTDELLFEGVSGIHLLFECRTVFVIIHEWTDATSSMIQLLNKNNVYTVVFVISENNNKEIMMHKLPRVEIFSISPEDDLMEVL